MSNLMQQHSSDNFNGNDEVFSSFRDLLIYARQYQASHLDANLELEIRIGRFSYDGSFIPGYYDADHTKIVQFFDRLKKSLLKSKDISPDHQNPIDMMRLYFDKYKNYRVTIIKDAKPHELSFKRKLGSVNINTDRDHQIRIDLSEESLEIQNNKEISEDMRQIPPSKTVLIQRWSFIEEVYRKEITQQSSSSSSSDPSFYIEIDLNKRAMTYESKNEFPKIPATYDCEIELKDFNFKQIKNDSDMDFIIKQLLHRAMMFLGTHSIDKNTKQSIKLPQPKLFLKNSTIPKYSSSNSNNNNNNNNFSKPNHPPTMY